MGKTSSMYNSFYFDKYNNNWVNDRRANDGVDLYAELNNTVTNSLDSSVPEGKSKATFNLYNWQSVGLTVENIQNTMIHEHTAHGQKGYPGGMNREHAKAVDLQKSHPTWKNTTSDFKDHLNGVREEMLQKQKQ